MKKTAFNAASLRIILILLLMLLIGAIGYGFYYAQNQLKTFSSSVVDSINKSKSGTFSSDGITALGQVLSQRASEIESADLLTPPISDYQSTVMKDLNNYASQSGLSIEDYSFMNGSDLDLSSAPITGIEIKYLKINLSNPITSASLIKFLKLIETNKPKLQITGVNVSQSSELEKINVDPLTIEIYTEI